MAGGVRRAQVAAVGERRPWTEEDARRVIASWEASGESLTSFARSAGLVPQRLAWWRKRLAGNEIAPRAVAGPAPAFLPVKVLVPPDPDTGPALVITGDGLRFEVRDVGLVPPAWVAELVAALRDLRP